VYHEEKPFVPYIRKRGRARVEGGRWRRKEEEEK